MKEWCTYKGRVCAKHPELAGERYVSTFRCRACTCAAAKQRYQRNASVIKAKKNADYRLKSAEHAVALREQRCPTKTSNANAVTTAITGSK